MTDPAATGAALPAALAWAHAHLSPWLAAPVLTATHAAMWARDRAADLARLAPYRQAAGNLWKNLNTTLRLLKGNNRTMLNALQLIPLAITGATDALKLTQAFEAGDKASAVAAVTDSIPLLAQLTGRPEADLAALLTPDALGAAFDACEAAEKIVVAIEQAIAQRAAHVAAAEAPAA